jgi:hypothetical protein
MLSAVSRALELVGDRVSPGDRGAIEQCAAKVRQALNSGDRNALKSANDELDAATQDLAAMVLDAVLPPKQKVDS